MRRGPARLEMRMQRLGDLQVRSEVGKLHSGRGPVRLQLPRDLIDIAADSGELGRHGPQCPQLLGRYGSHREQMGANQHRRIRGRRHPSILGPRSEVQLILGRQPYLEAPPSRGAHRLDEHLRLPDRISAKQRKAQHAFEERRF
jgi:hypothetical protein